MKNAEIEGLEVAGWPLPDEYLVEIGRISALWSTLESFLSLCIGKLAGFDHTDPKSFILLNHSSIPQKFDALGALCEQLVEDYPQLNGYKEVVSMLKSAQSARNRYLHNGLALDEETGRVEMPVGSSRGSLKVSVETVTVADLRRAWASIHEAQLALYKLVLGKTLPPAWSGRARGGT